MGLELDELATKIRVAMERSLMAEHAGVALRVQKSAITLARKASKECSPSTNVPCYLPASVLLSLAELGLKLAEPSKVDPSW